jgi:arsenite-transporting ATPase
MRNIAIDMGPPMNPAIARHRQGIEWNAHFPFFSDPGLRLLFFGGKGGVGKTTCATAAALHLAQRLSHTSFLLVSTDPAHSLLDSMAGFSLPGNVKTVELDAQACLATFKEKHDEKFREIASRGTFLDDDDISQFLNLSLPGLDELVAFFEISRWTEDGRYDCIVIDTAPTGHTLRLLGMPLLLQKWLDALDTLLAKHRFMKQLFSGSYRRDQLDEFLLELAAAAERMRALLKDPGRCRFVPVMLADALSIHETLALVDELEHQNMPVSHIVINKLYRHGACPVCGDEYVRQKRELAHLPEKLGRYSLWGAPLHPQEVRGVRLLDEFWGSVVPLKKSIYENRELQIVNRQSSIVNVEGPIDLPSPEMKLLLFAGKGGVGKTTFASATALRLASDLPGKEIFLFSTDPAHSLSACLDVRIGPEPTTLVPGLTAMEIDAEAELQTLKYQYSEEVETLMTGISPHLDLAFDHEVIKCIMELSPPGIDEVVALTLAMEFLSQGTYDIFILDSAPTGHLIRLLELPELINQWLKTLFGLFLKYRQVFRLPRISQRLVKMTKELKCLRDLLKNPSQSALYTVAAPTEMAFQETKDLVAACERMGINVPVLFLNLVTPPGGCALCSALHQRESYVKGKFQQAFSGIHQAVVYRQGEPRGLERLGKLGEALYRPKEELGIEGLRD